MKINETPIQQLEKNLYVKRDDLITFSFGGNKARKAMLFFEDIEKAKADCVVTYGSNSSNHCRVIANMAASKGIGCYIISPIENQDETYNSIMTDIFGAQRTYVPLEQVHDSIDMKLKELKRQGRRPYFIPGGGHGKIGTRAYVNCYEEIKEYEGTNGVYFDYIFLASGTGTTQAGLVCGQLLHNDMNRKIVGISIARENPRGRNIVVESIKEYLPDFSDELIQTKTIFLDNYRDGGYGKGKSTEIVSQIMEKYGIPLDPMYTGKAYAGMKEYIIKNGITEQKSLFIHTGGTPLFFDFLREIRK